MTTATLKRRKTPTGVPIRDRIGFYTDKGDGSGCWTWTGRINACGYGQLGVSGKLRSAHRLAYESSVGSIPDGVQVCHKCDVRSCVRPDHLFLGTQADNIRDMVSKGRARGGSHLGERNGRSKLSADQVREILAANGLTQRQIAAHFGVSQTLIGRIRSGKNWSQVTKGRKS
jgi:hypothetical protein